MAHQYNLTNSDSSDSEAQFEVGRLFELRKIRGYSKDPEVRSSLKLCWENYDYNIIYMYMYNNMIPVVKNIYFF